MARSAASWNRTDSLLVLASYMDRPPRLAIPPILERERVAALLGQPVGEVTRRLWAFAGLDPQNPVGSPDEAGTREQRLWNQYADDRLQLMLDADDLVEGLRRVPHYLS